MEAFETWMTAHPILVSVILTPIVSLIVGFVASWYSTHKSLKNAKIERNLNKYLKLSDYYNDRVVQQRENFSFLMAALSHHKQFRSPETSKEVSLYFNKVMLSVDPDDSDYGELSQIMIAVLRDSMDETSYTPANLLPFAQRIAQREERRLAQQLLDSDKDG